MNEFISRMSERKMKLRVCLEEWTLDKHDIKKSKISSGKSY